MHCLASAFLMCWCCVWDSFEWENLVWFLQWSVVVAFGEVSGFRFQILLGWARGCLGIHHLY